MKILFIGSRLFDDVSWYLKQENITSIITESNENAINLDLADYNYIVPRGMDKPMEIAIKEDVDAVIPLIGIDPPLPDVGKMKDELEEIGIPVIASSYKTASLAADKYIFYQEWNRQLQRGPLLHERFHLCYSIFI